MPQYKYQLALEFQAPLLTNAVGAMSFGVDMTMQRYRGRPVINGSLIRGNIKHALEYFASRSSDDALKDLSGQIESWFGSESTSAGMAPEPGDINFDYFWRLHGEGPYLTSLMDSTRYRVRIDDTTGSADRGGLISIESGSRTGERPVFTGTIRARLNDEVAAREFEKWVIKALDYIAAMGALKGVGFGRLLSARLLRIEEVAAVRQRAKPSSHARIGIVLHLDRPFCIARSHLQDSNRFESEEHIPGAALKGAVANHIGQDDKQRLQSELCFDQLVFTHALPARPGAPERNLPLPLSLASFDGRIRDLSLYKEACVLSARDRFIAPRFRPDWKAKDADKVDAAIAPDRASPPRFLSVHTAIGKEGVSAESQLFSQECIDPLENVWCADIDLSAIDDERQRSRVSENLLRIFDDEIGGIGKTKAYARIKVLRESFLDGRHMPCVEPIDKDKYIVLLRTAARILPVGLQVPATNGDKTLFALYDAYWRHASGGLLKLSHYYALQRLAGGQFYWKRYRNEDKHYRPEWLTVEGSVFVLKAASGDPHSILERLQNWMRLGLPPAEDRDDATWDTDPYIRENGYGEVVVNHGLHATLAPADGEIYELA